VEWNATTNSGFIPTEADVTFFDFHVKKKIENAPVPNKERKTNDMMRVSSLLTVVFHYHFYLLKPKNRKESHCDLPMI
jgi:hypothetical protein